MKIKLVCPECGKMNETDETHDVAFCIYCGAVIPNTSKKEEPFVDFKQQEEPHFEKQQEQESSHTFKQQEKQYKDVNLVIDFSSSDPNARMIISFDKLTTKRVIPAGQTAAIKIPIGHYIATMDLAGRSYTREIHIVEEAPVFVHAAAHGIREIAIEQPSYELEEPKPKPIQRPTPQQQPIQQKQSAPIVASQTEPTKNEQKAETTAPHPLSVIAFVLSLTFFASPVGFVIGIISAAISGHRRKAFSVLAIIFGAIISIVIFVIVITLILSGMFASAMSEASGSI